jgi:preprotein translocase subunit SecF
VSNFALAMNAGVIVGAYSSIFLAPPSVPLGIEALL